MINCKRHIIAAVFTLVLPFTSWSEAPVIDDSENFAMIDGQQVAEAPVVNPKYDKQQNKYYQMDSYQSDDDEAALVREDQSSESNNNNNNNNNINDNAKLIDKIQALTQDIQELRGQLEVQAHDLKLLQQQQIAFYKDLDTRLGSGSAKSAPSKPSTDMTLGGNAPAVKPSPSAAASAPIKSVKASTTPQPVIAVSRVNPADEQISYLAAYELVKNKRYDSAINAMQTFAQKYPKGGYTANAEYWLGELYLVKKDYPKAIEHFEVVLQQFPSSSKSAASMLKAGYAYAARGDNQEAKKRFQQVARTYPDTPTARLANSKLEAINAL